MEEFDLFVEKIRSFFNKCFATVEDEIQLPQPVTDLMAECDLFMDLIYAWFQQSVVGVEDESIAATCGGAGS
jgi:hypothetical protein